MATPLPSAPLPPPTAASGFGPYYPPAPPTFAGTPNRHADLSGLRQIRVAAVIVIVTACLGIIELVLNYGGGYTPVRVVTGATTTIAVNQAVLTWLVLVLLLSSALDIAGLAFFRSGFRSLREVDPRFSSTPSFAVLAIIGVAIVIVGTLLVLESLSALASCVNAGTGPGASGRICLPGAFLGGLALVGIGAIIALVGFIGTLVGIWRLGTRYHETSIHVGAILLIFGPLALVGGVLILVGTGSAERKVLASPASIPVPAYAFPPPPPFLPPRP